MPTADAVRPSVATCTPIADGMTLGWLHHDDTERPLGVTCTSRAVWPPPVDCEAPRSSHRESPGHEPGVKPRTTRRVVHAIPFNSESGREPGVSAAGAPGRHRQAHRGLPQGWLAGPNRRTFRDLDRRTRPHRGGEAHRDRRTLHRGKEVV